jgi:hypothetical protein
MMITAPASGHALLKSCVYHGHAMPVIRHMQKTAITPNKNKLLSRFSRWSGVIGHPAFDRTRDYVRVDAHAVSSSAVDEPHISSV